MQKQNTAPRTTNRDETTERIRRDAAAAEYRVEIRAMMRAGTLDEA